MKTLPVNSAIYRGHVRHRRFADVRHAFTYPLTLLYLDLEELPALFDNTPLWSARRPAPGWFRDSDYLVGTQGDSLRERVMHTIHKANGHWHEGPVHLLTQPRYFGFGMNPISCFYCFDKPNGSLQFMVAEVTNTPWRERIAYVLPCQDNIRQQQVRFAKRMHVSPFNPVNMEYLARFNTPKETLYLHLENHNATHITTDATLTLTRTPCTDTALVKLLWEYPLQTIQVATGIYWQAWQLWRRGARFYPHQTSKARHCSISGEIQP